MSNTAACSVRSSMSFLTLILGFFFSTSATATSISDRELFTGALESALSEKLDADVSNTTVTQTVSDWTASMTTYDKKWYTVTFTVHRKDGPQKFKCSLIYFENEQDRFAFGLGRCESRTAQLPYIHLDRVKLTGKSKPQN